MDRGYGYRELASPPNSYYQSERKDELTVREDGDDTVSVENF